jgi:hypothetical protein
MSVPHDLNKLPAYDHLKGSPRKSHEGSTFAGHSNNDTSYSTFVSGGSTGAKEKNPGGATPSKIGSGKGPSMDM